MHQLEKILFSISLFLLSFNVFSQKNFQEGYVVKMDTDTVTGFINDEGWVLNPEFVEFKNKVSGEIIKYFPKEISSFYVGSNHYKSANLEVDHAPYKDGELAKSNTPQFKKEGVFLLLLVGGDVSLYYLKDADGKEHFYIQKQKGKIDWLECRRYIKKENNQNLEMENQKYKGQLLYYLQECKKLDNAIKGIEYKKKQIFNLVLMYYNCIEKQYEYKQPKKRIKLKYGVLAGLSQTSLEFQESSDFISGLSESYSNSEFNKSTGFSGGAFVQIVFPQKKERFSLLNEFIYHDFETSATYQSYNIWFDTTYYNHYFNIGYLSINTMLQTYLVVKKEIQPFVFFGISNGLKVKYDKSITTERTVSRFSQEISYSERQEIPLNHQLGIIGGFGIQYKFISLSARIRLTNGIIGNIAFPSTTKNFQAYLIFSL